MRLLTIVAASDEDNLQRWLKEFEKRSLRSGGNLDYQEVSLNLRRWQRENRRKNPEIKKNPLEYKTPDELDRAMLEYRTEEEEHESLGESIERGTEEILQWDLYTAYEITTPEALQEMSHQGTHWCTKDLDTAKTYLSDFGSAYILARGYPLAVVFPNVGQIYWQNDKELTGEIEYPSDRGDTVISKKDFQALNVLLKELREKPLPMKSKFFVVK